MDCNTQRRWYDSAYLQLQSVRDDISAVFKLAPPLPETWTAEMMEQALVKLARCTLAALCPVARRKPRKEWITSATWETLAVTSTARRAFFDATRGATRSYLYIFFLL